MGEVERHWKIWIDETLQRILARRKNGVAVGGVLAGFAEDRIIDQQRDGALATDRPKNPCALRIDSIWESDKGAIKPGSLSSSKFTGRG